MCLAAVGSGCMCCCCEEKLSGVNAFLALGLELPIGPVSAPSAAVLNGKRPLTARCSTDKPALTDKAGQFWSTTELHNRNANICRVVPRSVLLRFD